VYAAVVARGRRYLVRVSLDTLEKTLDPALFTRVHRSFLVRLDRVLEVRRDGSRPPSLVLRTGDVIPVSRRRRGVLMALSKPLAT
jgi:two-component system LytT family response regulator